MSAARETALAGDFPPATAEQWRALAAAVLARSGVAGDPVEALTTRRLDELVLRPLYTSADLPGDPGRPGELPYVRGATADGATVGGWDVRMRHADPDPAHVRAAALTDLERGATSL